MNEMNKCPECGKTLPEDAPQGLCPKCLMGNVLNPTIPSADKSGAETVVADLPEKTSLSEPELFEEATGEYTLLGEYARG